MTNFNLAETCSKCFQPKKNNYHAWCNLCLNQYQRRYRKVAEFSDEAAAKIRARMQAQRAARKGLLIPKPCQRCGSKRVEMHHPDYAKPLEVEWFCRPCHRDHHDEEANKRLGKPEDWVFPEESKTA